MNSAKELPPVGIEPRSSGSLPKCLDDWTKYILIQEMIQVQKSAVVHETKFNSEMSYPIHVCFAQSSRH